MKCLNFGAKARNRIVIQSLSGVEDSYGGRTQSWVQSSNVYAIIEPASGRELFSQGMQQNRITHKITVRYQSILSNIRDVGDWRISFDGRLFGVKYIKNLHQDMKIEGKQYQVIYAEENSIDN